jgi:hypothetical protein
MKTNELTGAALDWAVGQATEFEGDWLPDYSTDWAHGGLIIECEIIGLDYDAADGWQARDFDTQQITATGKTPLIAAMRCYVASKLGDEVEVPQELLDLAYE